MKKDLNKIFILSILLLVFSVILILLSIMEEDIICIIFGVIVLLFDISFLQMLCPHLIAANRKRIWRGKQLTVEEQKMVEDAKSLVKCMDESIIIANFTVYKVKFLSYGWFDYDTDTRELCIFLLFNYFRRLGGKNLCFLTLVHEVLHSQNLKNNLRIFNGKFLEGLNQLLTVWLIENYSQEYSIPQEICIARLKLGKSKECKIKSGYNIYGKNVAMVQNILDHSKIDLRTVFLNYINLNPEFFKDFVPAKYFKKQYVNKHKTDT